MILMKIKSVRAPSSVNKISYTSMFLEIPDVSKRAVKAAKIKSTNKFASLFNIFLFKSYIYSFLSCLNEKNDCYSHRILPLKTLPFLSTAFLFDEFNLICSQLA